VVLRVVVCGGVLVCVVCGVVRVVCLCVGPASLLTPTPDGGCAGRGFSIGLGIGTFAQSFVTFVGLRYCALSITYRGCPHILLMVGLYKIFVYVWAVVHESTIRAFPLPTCTAHPGAIRLHDYWAVYVSPSDLPFTCYTPYNIGTNNIV